MARAAHLCWLVWHARCCCSQFLNIYDLVSLARAGERRPFFLKRAKQKGENFVLVNGVWATRHKDVAKLIAGSQGRGHSIGSTHVAIPKTFHKDAPVFLSNPSVRHTEIRGWLIKAVTRAPGSVERIKNTDTWIDYVKRWRMRPDPTKRAAITKMCGAVLFKTLFDIDLTESQLDLCVSYETGRLSQILPTWLHKVLCNCLSNKAHKTRNAFLEILRTHGTLDYLEEQARKDGIVDLTKDDLGLVVLDLFLFAGVIGSTHLVNAVVREVQVGAADSACGDREEVFKLNPLNFVLEAGRLDPPVTSINSILSTETTIEVQGKPRKLPAGTPYMGIIATANIDEDVWGADATTFDPRKREFRNVLSWNGALNVGPRACPGYDLSVLLGQKAGEIFLGGVKDTGTAIYTATLSTGDTYKGGTDRDMFLRIEGTENHSDDIKLGHKWRDDFKKGKDTVNTFETRNVGDVVRIIVWLDSGPLNAEWYCETVSIKVSEGPITKEWKFPAFTWLTSKTPKAVLLAGSASLPQNDDGMRALARRQLRAHKRGMYKYTTRHSTLGDGDLAGALPTMVKLVDGEIPPPDRPLSEQTMDVYKAGIDLFGNGFLKYLTSVGPLGFKTLEEYNDIFKLPNLIPTKGDQRKYVLPEDAWKDDQEFGRQRLAGLHPSMIKVCKAIPCGFHVTDADVKHALGGSTLEEALASGNLFICDYEPMVPFAGKHVVNGEKRYVYAPFALFFASWDKNQRLAPIAVQVLREPDALVWTSQDTPSDWVAAKFYVSNADFAVHQFRAHALWCHLAQEPILISVSRVLSECHPVWKLLRPHFHGLLNINDSARGTLVNVPSEEESMTDKIPGLKALAKLPTLFGNVLSMGAHGNAKLTIDIYKTYDLKAQWFKNDLEARGLLDPQACEALGPYPYRDDGLLLFDSIEKYVTAILRTYYKTDADITDDAELQEWAADASSAEAGAIKGFPTSFDNIDSLVEMCTNLIFTASAYHAAVNYSQVDYGKTLLSCSPYPRFHAARATPTE